MEKASGCPHGAARQLAAGAYAAPIGQCRCCGFHFMYIGMGSWSSSGDTDSVHPDPTLCVSCGGRPREFTRKNGEVVRDEGGSHDLSLEEVRSA